MKVRNTAVILMLLACACLPALADQSAPAGTDPVARVVQATTQHTDILIGLLSQVPDQAKSALEKALAASRKGHDAAQTALARTRPQAASRAATVPDTQVTDLRGLERARERVAAGFEKSVQVLKGLLIKSPEQAVEHVTAALEKVQEHRHVALDDLDRLIAGMRPQPVSVERPEIPERPERPERPDRPQIPERPQIPDRPEVPAIPDRPERPTPPVSGN
jgi:hypothetical protein